MSDAAAESRAPCPSCGELIVTGARKCRSCKRWLAPPPRHRWLLPLTLLATATALIGSLLMLLRKSPVGEAPPLTPMTAGPTSTASSAETLPSPASFGPDPEPPVLPVDPDNQRWRTRHFRIDVHPLGLAFDPEGSVLYVSSDDASVRAYDVASGKLLKMVLVPAQGDELRLLHGRYLAVLRHEDAAHVPIVDIRHWEQKPRVLHVGANPADVLALPDGKTAITASSHGRRLSWFDLESGKRLADLRLPNSPRRLFPMRIGERDYVAALGMQYRARRPAGATIELFDPSESPFGATRRSIAVGRDPAGGMVSRDGSALVLADKVSNSAWLVKLGAGERPAPIAVGQAPTGAFFLGERHGVTIDSQARTATVIDLAEARRTTTLMLPGPPSRGAVTPDGKNLFVVLGGAGFPPPSSGVAIIADAPPRVIAHLDTAGGAGRIAVSPDGRRAAIACYSARSITVVER